MWLEKRICQEFGLKNVNETRNHVVEEIQQNYFMSKKNKKVCTTLNYIEHFLILDSAVAGHILVSDFVSLLDVPITITSSAIGLKIFSLTAGIKKYNSIIKK